MYPMNRKKQIVIPLLVLCLLAIFTLGVSARGQLDPAKEASLTVDFSPDGKTSSGVEFRLYRVASVNKYCDFTLTDSFTSYPVSFDKMDQSTWRALAQTLNGYVAADKISPTTYALTDAKGKADFSSLTPALYLVTGNKFTKGDYTYTPTPFLVCVPSLDAGDEWQYDLTVKPKYEFLYKPVTPTVTRKVLKAWKEDDAAKRPASVSVTLYKDGTAYDHVILDAENNWRYTWDKLDSKADWQVVEDDVPKDYTVTVVKEGITFLVTNTFEVKKPVERTVKKEWKNDKEASRPSSVSVTLTKDGADFETVALSAENNWQYTWKELTADAEWAIRENDVPAGYTASVSQDGTVFTLTNTGKEEEEETVERTVEKVWAGDDDSLVRPSDITVELLENGAVFDTVTLSSANNWRHTWTELKKDSEWQVREVNVPSGYTSAVSSSGTTFTVTNTYKAPPSRKTVDYRVIKVWAGDDDTAVRPNTVTVELLRNGDVEDTVTLSADNGWSHQWNGLSAGSSWSLREVDVPAGYTSSVTFEEGVFTVKNTYSVPDDDDKEDDDDDDDDGDDDKEDDDDDDEEEEEEEEDEEFLELDENGVPRGRWVPSEEDEEEFIELDDEGVPTGRRYRVTPEGEYEVFYVDPLPQSGMLLWPIPVMIALGLLFIICGLVLIIKKRRSDS